MTDLREAIEPKSDQLNSDDLISGPITIKITSVKTNKTEQPVSIHYEGDNGKPWKPCKSSLRTLIAGWKTSDGDKFVGRQVTLYLDSDVTWAGQAVGGIRVSHMSDIDKPLRLMLTKSRGKKVSHEVGVIETKPKKALTDEEFATFDTEINNCSTMPELQVVGKKIADGGFDDEGNKRIKKQYTARSKAIREQSN